MEIPIQYLSVDPANHAGPMDVTRLAEVDDRPIEVTRIGSGQYRILNGRHRFVRALLAGQATMEAVLR